MAYQDRQWLRPDGTAFIYAEIDADGYPTLRLCGESHVMELMYTVNVAGDDAFVQESQGNLDMLDKLINAMVSYRAAYAAAMKPPSESATNPSTSVQIEVDDNGPLRDWNTAAEDEAWKDL